jgi:hypothetical protein
MKKRHYIDKINGAIHENLDDEKTCRGEIFLYIKQSHKVYI